MATTAPPDVQDILAELGGRGDRPPREVIEAALAHVVRSRVEAAYARSDLFERRRLLMDDWAMYLGGPMSDSTKR